MPSDDDGADKPTEEAEVPTEPLIDVDVSRETTRKAARLADECGIALEDALARLTAYDYPVDVVSGSRGCAESNSGP